MRTTGLRWFLMLRLLAGMRGMRRRTLRYVEEQARIAAWLDLARQAAQTDRAAAIEILRCQNMIKGYSDTFERGLAHFQRVMAAVPSAMRGPDAAARIAALHDAALSDDKGEALGCALAATG